MKNVSFVFLLFLGFSLSLSAQNMPKITIEGNKFIKEGQPFVFRGLNISDPYNLDNKGHWDKRLFEELVSWGANVVRFPVHPKSWRAKGQEGYLKLLDEGIALAQQHGLYVIIDWHSIGNLRTEMYQADMYETTRKETFEFWRIIADRYKNNTAVAFYEIFNEPTTIQGKLGNCTWAEWKDLNEEIFGLIRANGGTGIPLVAGFNWAYDLTNVKSNPINAVNIAYVAHPYPQKRAKPWEVQWENDWGFVAKTYPLILTEIGFSLAEEQGAHIPVISDETYGDAITKYTAERGISYVVWVFDANWAPRMFKDWETFEPTTQGAYFKAALRRQNGLE